MPDAELTAPRQPRRKRDEAVRRLMRRLRHADPALNTPAATLSLRRLAQLSLLSEKLYERAKSAELGDDPQAFIFAVEAFRRACQTASVLERNLHAATNAIEPPPDITIELARRIAERREQAGVAIPFSPADRNGQN